jgi:hypothetical protein
MKNKLVIAFALIVFSSVSVAADLTAKEKSAIVNAVKEQLKDPDSAKFKWVKLADRINPKNFVDSYCGLVNAKNSYGGYTGFEPFEVMVARSDNNKFEVISVSVSSSALPTDAIVSMCSDNGYTDFSSAK